MNSLMNRIKKNSLKSIILFGSLCISFAVLSVLLNLISYFMVGAQMNLADILISIFNGTFIYIIAVVLLIAGKKNQNDRFLTMAVGLILIYLSVKNFVDGLVDIFSIRIDPQDIYSWIIALQTVLQFGYGVIWLFILFALCADYLNNSTRRTNLISTLIFSAVIIEVVISLLYISNIINVVVNYGINTGISSFLLYSIAPLFAGFSLASLLMSTLSGFIDLRYEGPIEDDTPTYGSF